MDEVMQIFYGLVMLLFVLLFSWFLKEWLFGSEPISETSRTYVDTVSGELLTVKIEGKNTLYLLNGKAHRMDGAAFSRLGEFKIWYRCGDRHREDGPAVEYSDGTLAWFLNGEKLDCQTHEQFERMMKLRSFW